jgi:O-acetyl-ADP-ribose deacetylase (regulator of RNase III)
LEEILPRVLIVNADVTTVIADALIATINPSGWWISGLHEKIRQSSGNLFHAVAEAAMPLQEGQIIYAEALIPHGGMFDSVIFVVDNNNISIYDAITSALETTLEKNISTVSVPTFDADIDDLVELAQSISDFLSAKPNIKEIIVVVSNENDKFVLEDELWLV